VPVNVTPVTLHDGIPLASFADVVLTENVAPVPLPPDAVIVGATRPSFAYPLPPLARLTDEIGPLSVAGSPPGAVTLPAAPLP
jgi:hypothetical protein